MAASSHAKLIACNCRVLLELLDPLVRGGKMERGGHLVLLDTQDPVDILETKEIQVWLEDKDRRDLKDQM